MDQGDSTGEDYQLRLESESEAISILTVHKSKGLEYPIVFLPSLSLTVGGGAKSFNYHQDDGTLVVDLHEVASDSAKEKGKLEDGQEDARVLYVAMTRAASRCYLYHAPYRLSEDDRPSAQARIMKSWGNKQKPEQEDGSVDNFQVGQFVNGWIEENELSEMAQYHSFLPDQEELDG